MASLLELLGQTWPARLAKSAVGAAALPGDVYAGRVDPLSEEGIGKAADLAGMVMGGTFAGAPRGAMGAGPIRAYHGSPHDFERFDLSKIGTGEGAQAYGHGLYFAENPATAQSYRDALAGGPQKQIAGAPYDSKIPEHLASSLLETFARKENPRETAIAALKYDISNPKLTDAARQHYQSVVDLLSSGKPLPDVTFKPSGRMYEVNINAQPEQFLQWDKPLREQAANIRSFPGLADAAKEEAYQRAIASTNKQRADQLWSMVKDPEAATGQMAYQEFVRQQNIPHAGRSAAVSEQLKEAGIPGIKYLDQGSRAAGEGSSNYVLFRDDIISIIRKYGWAGLGLFGISPEDAKAAGVEKGQTNNLRIGNKTYGD